MGDGMGDWTPTHEVPPGGLPAWAHPDPATPVIARLQPGTPVQPVGDPAPDGPYQRVLTAPGTEVWVDGSRLAPLSSPPATSPAGTAHGARKHWRWGRR